MAMENDATDASEFKICPQCLKGRRRLASMHKIHFLRQRFCSRSCASAAKVKKQPDADLSGAIFGRWTVLRLVGRSIHYRGWMWECRCECGVIAQAEQAALKTGNSKSCGCGQREAVAKASKARATHGMTKVPEYYIWSSMKQRCLNPKVRNFASYGGRGILVCDRWRGSFENFYADMGPRPSAEHSIDRIDNDGSYEPGNCRWSIDADQVRNRRSNVLVVVGGVEMVLADAARAAGVKFTTALARYRKGWPIDRVLGPVR